MKSLIVAIFCLPFFSQVETGKSANTAPSVLANEVNLQPNTLVYAPEQDSSCIFKAGAFLRLKDNRESSNGLDAYVISCNKGYYKYVTRKYVPGQKSTFAQNKNIPHYTISETSAPRGYMEKHYELSSDFKAGRKITVCIQCRGIGAEYFAEQFVNGKWESVNVTHKMSTLDSKVIVYKNSCSKCYGDGWKVQK